MQNKLVGYKQNFTTN